MNFLQAVRLGRWIRRKGSSKVVCVSETPTHIYSVARSDLLAEDWEVVDSVEQEKMDDSEKRFSLLELDVDDR